MGLVIIILCPVQNRVSDYQSWNIQFFPGVQNCPSLGESRCNFQVHQSVNIQQQHSTSSFNLGTKTSITVLHQLFKMKLSFLICGLIHRCSFSLTVWYRTLYTFRSCYAMMITLVEPRCFSVIIAVYRILYYA